MESYLREHASDMRKRATERDKWISKWPFHCTWCHGFGTDLGEDEDLQPCQCALKKQCPRCGAANAVRVTNHHPVIITTCTACKWDLTSGGLPE